MGLKLRINSSAMSQKVSHELEIDVPASVAWELYGSLEMTKLVVEKAKHIIEKLEVEGDGGVGTLVTITLVQGTSYKERFMEIDDVKRVKVVELIEGGYLEMGFSLYRFRVEVIEKGNSSCIITCSIEYELKEEVVGNASLVDIQFVVDIGEIAKKYLLTKYNT